MTRRKLVLLVMLPLLLGGIFAVLRVASAPEVRTRPTTLGPAGGRVYWTWETMEFDKCSAAWMIKRFVDKEAEFQFCPQPERPSTGTPFDVPGARWARTARECTFELVLRDADLDDPALVRIARMAHVIEIGKWYMDSNPEARRHHEAILAIIEANPDPAMCFEKTRAYFDALYKELARPTSQPEDLK